MFGNKVKDFQPGDEITLENGREVRVIAKGDSGSRVGITDGRDPQIVDGNVPARKR